MLNVPGKINLQYNILNKTNLKLMFNILKVLKPYKKNLSQTSI